MQSRAQKLKKFGIINRFSRDDRGVTAIEYSIVIGPFLLFLFMILENGMSMLGQQLLEDRVSEHSRLIRTGQAQSSFSQAEFKTLICDTVGLVLRDCETALLVDVQTFTDPATIDFSVPVDADGVLDPSMETYDTGGRLEYVVVRAYYQYDRILEKMWIPGAGEISIFPNGVQLLTAATAFRNEPF